MNVKKTKSSKKIVLKITMSMTPPKGSELRLYWWNDLLDLLHACISQCGYMHPECRTTDTVLFHEQHLPSFARRHSVLKYIIPANDAAEPFAIIFEHPVVSLMSTNGNLLPEKSLELQS